MGSVSYKFSNLLGVTFAGGSVTFTEDGNGLLSAAGNRVVYKDLAGHQSFVLGVEAPQDIDHLLHCPQREGSRLSSALVIDTAGHVLLLNIKSLVALARLSLKRRVTAAAVSPCGRYVAFGMGTSVACWEVPSEKTHWNFSRVFDLQGHTERINSISWAPEGLLFLSASADCTIRVWAVNPPANFSSLTFIDHNRAVQFAAFSEDCSRIISVGIDGLKVTWEWTPEAADGSRALDISRGSRLKRREEKYMAMLDEKYGAKQERDDDEDLEPRIKRLRPTDPPSDVSKFVEGSWKLESRVLMERDGITIKVTKCAYFAPRDLLVVAMSNGLVEISEKGHVVEDGRVSFGNCPIGALALNSDAEWVAIGSPQTGLLAVWEWLSGTYILKDQGDRYGSRAVALMPAGILDPFSKAAVKDVQDRMIGTASRNIVASGSIVGGIKLWDANSGRSFASFQAHDGPVTGLAFTPQMNAVISSGQDGKVKAFDLLKGQCFRTMEAEVSSLGVAPQLSSLAVDPSGEIVVGSSLSSDCRIFIWSLQTGKLIDTLVGPEEPVTAVAFSSDINNPGQLAASSYDGSVYLWDIFGRAKKGGSVQILKGNTGAVALAYDPRGNGLLAVSHFGGHIVLWDADNEEIVGHIDGARDIEIGRTTDQLSTADNSRKLFDTAIPYSRDANPDALFTSICFTGHGQYIAAACKESAKICIYSTSNFQLNHSFKLTHNRSIDGLLRVLNSKFVTETGVNVNTLDLSDDEMETTFKHNKRKLEADQLPGVNLGEAAAESERRKLKVWSIQASTDARQLLVATSHGVFCYAMDHNAISSASSITKNHVLFSHLNSFAPVALSAETTRANVLASLKSGNMITALRLALAMNNLELIAATYVRLTPKEIPLLANSMDPRLVSPLLNFIRLCLSPHLLKDQTQRDQIAPAVPYVEVHLRWLVQMLTKVEEKPPQQKKNKKWAVSDDAFGTTTRDQQLIEIRTLLLMILKQIQENKEMLTTLFEENKQLLHFLAQSVN